MFAEQFFNDRIEMRNILCCGSKKVANSAEMRAQLYLAVDEEGWGRESKNSCTLQKCCLLQGASRTIRNTF